MNLITEIKEIIQKIDGYFGNNIESNELIYQLKILSAKIDQLKKEINSGKIQDQFEHRFNQLIDIQYAIHHQALSGPLARILGLVSLIEMEIDHIDMDQKIELARIKELNMLSNLLTKEIKYFKKQIMYILEGNDNPESRRCNICGKKG